MVYLVNADDLQVVKDWNYDKVQENSHHHRGSKDEGVLRSVDIDLRAGS